MHSSQWRPIPGFPRYEASTDGRIRSVERVILKKDGKRQPFPSVVLTPRAGKKGKYQVITLINEKGRTTRHIHRVILETFDRPRREGEECRHLDGNHQNNALTNICWGTKKENNDDKITHGTVARGSRVNTCVLNEAQVCTIFEKAHSGTPHKQLAAEFGVSVQTVEKIKYRKSWKWLLPPT